MVTDAVPVLAGGFASDPHGWFEWLRLEMASGRWDLTVASITPAVWRNGEGHGWRVVRTGDGVEVRPELENPFIFPLSGEHQRG